MPSYAKQPFLSYPHNTYSGNSGGPGLIEDEVICVHKGSKFVSKYGILMSSPVVN